MFKGLTIFCVVFTVIVISMNAFSQQGALEKLEQAYKNINDISGNFTQKSYIKELNKTQQFKGRFFIKKDKIRWNYLGAYSQIVFINKEKLVIYDRAKKQAIQTTFSADKYGQLPIALISRMADLKKDFEVKEIRENRLILIPKTKMGNINSIEIITQQADFPIKTLKITDTMSNQIEIEFSNVKINSNLRDSIFKFVPRKDDTVVTY